MLSAYSVLYGCGGQGLDIGLCVVFMQQSANLWFFSKKALQNRLCGSIVTHAEYRILFIFVLNTRKREFHK